MDNVELKQTHKLTKNSPKFESIDNLVWKGSEVAKILHLTK